MNSKGVYKITNIKNNKIYIGSTNLSFMVRWNKHRSALKRNKHHSIHLQNAWNKYGESCFKFDIILKMDKFSRDDILDKEEVIIKSLKSYLPQYGYNMTSCARYGNDPLLKRSVVGFDLYGNKIHEFECAEEAIRAGFSHARDCCNTNSNIVPISTSQNVYFKYKDEIGNVDKIKVTAINKIFIINVLNKKIIKTYDLFDDVPKLTTAKKCMTDKLRKLTISREDNTLYCKLSTLEEAFEKCDNLSLVCVYDENGNFESKHLNARNCGRAINRTRIAVKNAICKIDNLKLVKNKYIIICKNKNIPLKIKLKR